MPPVSLRTDQITEQVRALFGASLPVDVRCRALLNGDAAGRVLADNAARPAWAIAQELADNTLFLGGSLTETALVEAIQTLRRDRDVVAALWPGDPRRAWLPAADYTGMAIDFTERATIPNWKQFLAIPAGCRLERVDAALFARLPGREWTETMFGSADRALAQGLGFALLEGDTLVCEAFAGPRANGVIEIGTGTAEGYQGLGYATTTCAHLIAACEARGERTFWNAASSNAASLALARKLGYTREQPFDVLAWNRLGP